VSKQDAKNYATASLFSLEGKTALVTGGSSGLGLIMAKGLLCNGARVVIASRSQEKCDMAITELSEFGECFALATDVTKNQDREALLRFV
jgi:NAD(P)-dependent dehydrogenase (short-subunit alcohol dehydrogenase family)